MPNADSSSLQIVSDEDSKNNRKYLKAGVVATALVSGAVPYIVAAGIVAKTLRPVVSSLLTYAKSNCGTLTFHDETQVLHPSYPPACFIKLEYEVAANLEQRKKLAEEIGVPYMVSILMHKIVWEHIRITSSKQFNGKCLVSMKDVRRKMSMRERNKFLEFRDNYGQMPIDWILDAQC